MPTMLDATALMHAHTKSEALRKHMYSVETAMRAYARRFGENEELWAMTGVLHDFDYEEHPNPPDHPLKGSEVLEQAGYPGELRVAILGHASYTGVKRESRLAKALFACDELCGFIGAVAVIRPNKILDLEPSSVKKKLKDKAFARNVSREDIYSGAQELEIPFDEHLAFVIEAMKGDAERLGLK